MLNRSMPALVFAAWLTATGAVAQTAADGAQPTPVSGVTVTVTRKSTPLSAVTVKALANMTLCRKPTDGQWSSRLFDESAPARKRRTGPSSGTEAFVRTDVAAISQGTRDYSHMASDTARSARNQLPLIQQRFKCLGAFKSIRFLHASDAGFDDYEIEFENGALETAIGPFDARGETHAQYLRFYQPQPVSGQLGGLIASLQKERPDRRAVSPAFAAELEDRWPVLRRRFEGWGRLVSIDFVRRTDAGAYIYIATLSRLWSGEAMKTAWAVTVDPKDGRLDSLTFALLSSPGHSAPEEASEVVSTPASTPSPSPPLQLAQASPVPTPPAQTPSAQTPSAQTPAAQTLAAQTLAAQTPPGQTEPSPTPVSPLTVQAPPADRAVLEKQARGFVEAYAAPTAKLNQFARWYGPACVLVTGVIAEQAAQVRARVEAVAKAVGAPLAPSGCNPNIEIDFTTAPQRDLDAITARNSQVLGYDGAKTVTRPIQAWYATQTLGQAGPARGEDLRRPSAPGPATLLDLANSGTLAERARDTRGLAADRRCIDARSPTCPHSGFLNVLVIVDAGRMGDVSLDLTADYVAMLALSQPRALDGCKALPSVIDLYAGVCPGRQPPSGLTPGDTAYLTALYAADLTVEKASEEQDIAGRMVKTLAAVKPLAPSPKDSADKDAADAIALISSMAVDAKVTELSGLDVVARPKVTALSGVDVVATPKPKPTALSELDVVARPRALPVSELDVEYPVKCLPPRKPVNREAPSPQLVSTYPANGETVPPGYAVLRLTFDVPMACRGSAGVLQTSCRTKQDVTEAVAREPEFAEHLKPRWIEIWHQSYDRRTLLILCKLLPNASYVMVFNQDKVWEHFVGLSGREPNAGQWAFATSDAPDVTTVAAVVGRDPQLPALIKRDVP